MFNQLFFRSDALARQLLAPVVDERRRYLAQCASQGMSRKTLRTKSQILLSIVESQRLGQRPKQRISLAAIQQAARRWSRHNWPSAKSLYVKQSRAYFITQAVRWLTFVNPLQATSKPQNTRRPMVTEFPKTMREERSFSPHKFDFPSLYVRR